MTKTSRPLMRTVERRNGEEIVVYRPNPKYPREKALKELTKLVDKIVSRGRAS